jgi:hypothetical protein
MVKGQINLGVIGVLIGPESLFTIGFYGIGIHSFLNVLGEMASCELLKSWTVEV